MGSFLYKTRNNKPLGPEISPNLHYKLHDIAKYEDRSANGQIMYLLRKCIKAFEEKEGVIEVSEELQTKP